MVDSSTGGNSTLVSMFTDDDTISAYVPVASSGGSTSVTETTGNLGEFDFDGASPTSGLTATGSPVVDDTNAYTSPNSVNFNSASEYYTVPITSSTTVFVRLMVNVGTAPTASSTQFLGLYNGSAQLINLFFNATDGLIKANNTAGTNTVTTCSASALTPGTWHRVELAWTQSSTAGSFQVLIDGTSECNVSGVTTGSSPATSVRFGEMTAPSPAWVFNIDNVGISNTALLGAVTLGTSAATPLYDAFGSAAAAAAASLPLTGGTLSGTLTLNNGHLVSIGTAPTVSVGSAAGSGATATVTGTDTRGNITLNAVSTAGTSGAWVTVTFNRAYATAPIVILTPANTIAAGANTLVFVASTTTGFSINSTASPSTSTVTWNYIVID